MVMDILILITGIPCITVTDDRMHPKLLIVALSIRCADMAERNVYITSGSRISLVQSLPLHEIDHSFEVKRVVLLGPE